MDLASNLKNTRVYLVGAMDRVPDGGVQWRDRITPFLEGMGVKVLNPCDPKTKAMIAITEEESRGVIQHYKDTTQYHRIKPEFGIIRGADLRCVDVSDFIIAHIDIEVHACGTYEEITTANRQKKPVLIWCEQGKKNAPNWLFFMLPHEHIFGSMEDLMYYLSQIHATKDVKGLKRWFFFPNL